MAEAEAELECVPAGTVPAGAVPAGAVPAGAVPAAAGLVELFGGTLQFGYEQ